MNTAEYTTKAAVIGPEIVSAGLFLRSRIAAIGIPKFETGPQKWVVKTYLRVSLLKIFCESFCAAEFVTGEDMSVALSGRGAAGTVLCCSDHLESSRDCPGHPSSPGHLFSPHLLHHAGVRGIARGPLLLLKRSMEHTAPGRDKLT